MIRIPVFVAALVLGAHLSSAACIQQGTRPPTADELVSLIQAGLTSEELATLLDRNGVPVLAREDLGRVSQAGAPLAIVARLRSAAEKAAPPRLTLDDVVNLSASGVPDESLVKLIASSESTFPLTTEQWLELVRKGVSPAVLKALRAKALPDAARRPDSREAAISADDLPKLCGSGVPSDEIIRRIRTSDTTFDVTVDQLVLLSRQGVPKEVLKEVWARRPPVAQPAQPAKPVDPGAPASRPTPASSSAVDLHVEEAAGFSMLAPKAFRMHREARGANALLSFVAGESTPGGLGEAELSVFRYRSSMPERLSEANLTSLADNFLNRLQASYAQKKMTVSFGDRVATRLAGQPALRSPVVTAAADGTTHQGVIVITYSGDQIFAVSTAIRSDQVRSLGDILDNCVTSFALATRKPRPSGGATDAERLRTLTSAWADSLTSRDYAVYESLFATAERQLERRQAFVELCNQADPSHRLTPGNPTVHGDDAEIVVRFLGTDPEKTLALKWRRDGQSFALLDSTTP